MSLFDDPKALHNYATSPNWMYKMCLILPIIYFIFIGVLFYFSIHRDWKYLLVILAIPPTWAMFALIAMFVAQYRARRIYEKTKFNTNG